eukprot:TRINITY_DN4280_c0_g1_i10.p1 TRINITY_DN4280_c0_g1~~TRINITY_DN4280_c0_g1_i10.p1  ORF type:complete len:294 (-),score=22.77 TRINITY_DN4280_c0_g1_i10:62-943(-)
MHCMRNVIPTRPLIIIALDNIMSSIKVGVRVRPFSSREKSRKAKCVVSVEKSVVKVGGLVSLARDGVGRKERARVPLRPLLLVILRVPSILHYRFQKKLDGKHVKSTSDSPYAEQKDIFASMVLLYTLTKGLDIVNDAFEGYNVCLLAYGQTGAGKTYSMMGSEADEGLVASICKEILKRIEDEVNKRNCCAKYEVTASMLEIYNERIQDLFVDPNNRLKSGLKVYQSPTIGVFVGNLSKVPITSYEKLQHQLDIGNFNKAVGLAKVNSRSSCSHTICKLIFKQRYFVLLHAK